MERKPIVLDPAAIPETFRVFLLGAQIYDSSCSPQARVYFIDKDGGFYLKTAPKGTLNTECVMTQFFHSKGLASEVLFYEQAEQDWLLTRQLHGEDCTHQMYLSDPKRLCDITAELLRQLHDTDYTGCPIPDRMSTYRATAERNYRAKHYDASLFPDNWGYASAEDAWKMVDKYGHLLKTDTLLHGDYCQPNIILNDWQFSGFIDLDGGGIGDRHIDLFWGTWSLAFNLKTGAYYDRFLDAYGRDRVDPHMMELVAAFEVFG